MPALSKVQQRLMGMAYAYKKGELDSKEASQEVKDLADSMTLVQLKKFAATKHEGLPETVPENIQVGQINGMGPIELPADGLLGSGDVPAGKGDAKKEYKKKKKKMSNFKKFIGGLNSQQVSEAKKYNAKDIIDAWENAYGEDIMNSDHADVPDDIDNDHKGKVTIKDLEEIFDDRYGEELPSEFLDALGESVVNETRFYAIFQGAKHEIEANSLWAAKQKAITDLKVKKKDVGLLAIVNADEHDDFSKGKKGQFQFESDQVDEVYTGTASDFKYEFQNQFEDVTGFSDKAIKSVKKRGKNGYEVRTSTYAGREYMEAVGKEMGLEVKEFAKHSNMCITVYEAVISEIRMSSWGDLEYTEEDIEQTWGWCGTLSDEFGQDKALELTHQAIKDITSFFKFKDQWTALALVNSKAGRHAADAYINEEGGVSDILSSFIWYYGSESKVKKHAKDERKLQFPSK